MARVLISLKQNAEMAGRRVTVDASGQQLADLRRQLPDFCEFEENLPEGEVGLLGDNTEGR